VIGNVYLHEFKVPAAERVLTTAPDLTKWPWNVDAEPDEYWRQQLDAGVLWSRWPDEKA
jgi:hypothetical protein